MKIETLKSRKRKYFLYVLVVGVGLLLILNLTTTKAKYKTVESIPIVKGTIKNYSPYDFKLIAVKIENDNGDYETTDTIPTSEYMLNTENSYCTIPDENGNNVKDDSISIEYIDGLINFIGISKRNTKCTLYFDILNLYEYDYTGDSQLFVANKDGYYQIELWGASGTGDSGGKGSYTKGSIFLNQTETLYLYLGEIGIDASTNRTYGTLSFNGGSGGSYACRDYYLSKGINQAYNHYGGGATDIRFFESIPEDLSWANSIGLASRLMVAAGGASYSAKQNGSNGGGITGYSGNAGTGGSQTSAGGPNSGSFEKAGVPPYLGNICNDTDRYGAGSGYYGGGASNSSSSVSNNSGLYSAGSGSSFISGHTGCVAIKSSTDITPKDGCTTGTTDNACSIHYSGKTFTDTLMIDGAGYSWTNAKGEQVQMPNPQGGYYDLGVGHTGNGYARITYLGKVKIHP